MLLTEAQKKYKSRFTRVLLLFAVLLPFFSMFFVGGIELIVYYFSSEASSGVGIVAAQLLQVIKNAIVYSSLLCTIFAVGASISAFGEKQGALYFLISVTSPIVSGVASLFIVFILVVLGIHDYTLSLFAEYLPVLMTASGITALESILVITASYIVFWLGNGARTPDFLSERSFSLSVRIVFIIAILIRLAALVTDLVSYKIDLSSADSVLSGIVYPIGIVIFEIVSAFFATKGMFAYLSQTAQKFGIKSFSGKKEGKKR